MHIYTPVISMDINENPQIGQDPRIFIRGQNGTIYFIFNSQITTTDQRYTLVNWRANAGWKDPGKYEVSLSPSSRRNLNELILEMRKVSKFPWDNFYPAPPPKKTLLAVLEPK